MDTDKITAELKLAGVRTIRSEIHIEFLIPFFTKKKCLKSARIQLL
jgi:hypothetical protein